MECDDSRAPPNTKVDGKEWRPEWNYRPSPNKNPNTHNSPDKSTSLMCPCKTPTCGTRDAEVRQPFHDGKVFYFKHHKIDSDSKYNPGQLDPEEFGPARVKPQKFLPPCKLLR